MTTERVTKDRVADRGEVFEKRGAQERTAPLLASPLLSSPLLSHSCLPSHLLSSYTLTSPLLISPLLSDGPNVQSFHDSGLALNLGLRLRE
jgi:hypothetical protein